MEQLTDLGDGYQLWQDDSQFCFGQDSVLLANFAALQPGDRVVDLCAGNGAVSVLLCAAHAGISVTGVELQEAAFALAVRNGTYNGLDGRLSFIRGDVRHISRLLPAGSADAVVCNPPYRQPGTGRLNPNSAKAIARFELCLTLDDVCAAAAHLLRPNGRLYLVHLPSRLGDCLCTMRAHGLEPKTMQLAHPTIQMDAALVLIEAVRGGKPGLCCPAPIILQQEESQ